MKKIYSLISGAVAGLVALGMGSAVAASGLNVNYINDTLSLNPNSDVWEEASPVSVSLMAQQIVNPRGGGSVSNVMVSALHNGSDVAFKVTWKDSSKDTEAAIDSFRDGVAIQFPVNATGTPSPFMGDTVNPVNIWQWKADWQAEAEGTRNLEARQPQQDGMHAFPQDAQILKANFPAKPSANATMVEYIASGWGTLTKQEMQNVMAKGVYDNGEWSVVFLRSFNSSDASDAKFMRGRKSFINFAVWNGSNGDVNGMKSVSMNWVPLYFK